MDVGWYDSDYGFPSYDPFDDGFSLAFEFDNDNQFNEFGVAYDDYDEFGPQYDYDDFSSEFPPQYDHEHPASDNGLDSVYDPEDGSGWVYDSEDGFRWVCDSEDGFGWVGWDCDSEDGSGSVYDSEDGSGSVFDSRDGFSLQRHYKDGFGSVFDSGDGFRIKDYFYPGGFGLVDDHDQDYDSKNDEFSLQNGSHEAKWIKHYCNTQDILLVGEGDFSFATCLANCFGSATNMVATSLDSYDFIVSNYGYGARENVKSLRDYGCKVMHEVDAQTMAAHEEIGSMSFDRIVFNFPHAGFNKLESRQSQIQRHRHLVRNFFENARKLLSKGGEVHVVHKTNGFFREWRIEELAAQSGLQLIEKSPFRLNDYPGYQNKYGAGGNKNFNWIPSMTYKFGLPTY